MRSEPLRVVFVMRSFVVRDGKTLLIRRVQTNSHNPGKWECPGGKVDVWESLASARAREVLQETGLITEPISGLAYVIDHQITDGRYIGLLSVTITNAAKIISGNISLQSDEHDGFGWVSYKGLLKFDTTLETAEAARALRRYLR